MENMRSIMYVMNHHDTYMYHALMVEPAGQVAAGEDRSRPVSRMEVRAEKVVGAPGFEPGTFCTPSKRATSLRYAPT